MDTAAELANSVGNVTSSSITELDGAGPQPVAVATGVLFKVTPSDQRPDHPVGGARAQPTETSDLVDSPLRDIEETLDDVESPRNYLSPRTMHALRQRRVRHDRNAVCHFHIGPAMGVNGTHDCIEADGTQVSGVSEPIATLTSVTSSKLDTASRVDIDAGSSMEDSLPNLL